MNLNEIAQSFATENREAELLTPEGTGTGWIFQLRHESSKEVQAFMRDYRSKLQDAALKRKTAQQKSLMMQHEDGLRVAHVAGWRWDKGEDESEGRPPFSTRRLRALLTGTGDMLTGLTDDQKVAFGWHVRTFIDSEVGSLEDFLQRSENS